MIDYVQERHLMADEEPTLVRRKDIYKGPLNHLPQGRISSSTSSNPPTYLNFNTTRVTLPSTSISTTNTTNMPSEAQIAGGHKANLNNPNTSEESKQHSREVLENDLSDGKLRASCYCPIQKLIWSPNISAERIRLPRKEPRERCRWSEGVSSPSCCG